MVPALAFPSARGEYGPTGGSDLHTVPDYMSTKELPPSIRYFPVATQVGRTRYLLASYYRANASPQRTRHSECAEVTDVHLIQRHSLWEQGHFGPESVRSYSTTNDLDRLPQGHRPGSSA